MKSRKRSRARSRQTLANILKSRNNESIRIGSHLAFNVGMRISKVLRSLTLASLALSATALIGCASPEQDDADDVEGVAEPLPANLTPGKEDGIGRRGLPVDGDYADTEAWKVKNRWEDRTTAEAKKAGKDKIFVAKLGTLPLPQLLDLGLSATSRA